jgi:hypothetical protein
MSKSYSFISVSASQLFLALVWVVHYQENPEDLWACGQSASQGTHYPACFYFPLWFCGITFKIVRFFPFLPCLLLKMDLCEQEVLEWLPVGTEENKKCYLILCKIGASKCLIKQFYFWGEKKKRKENPAGWGYSSTIEPLPSKQVQSPGFGPQHHKINQ